jgi:copper chaperone CopZ
MKTIKLKVNGIHCNGCATKIKNGLNVLNPQIVSEVNIETGDVKVEFNKNDISVNAIKEKIIEVGFQVESIELE